MRMSETERAIYAAAYVAEFNRLHSAGVHPHFRESHEDTSERVNAWELWCAECGIESAQALIDLHRKTKP